MKINSSDLSRICIALALCGLASGCPDSDHTLGTTNDLKDGAAGTGGDVDLADASPGTGGTVGSGGQAASGGNPAGGAIVTGGAAPGGAIATGGAAPGGAMVTGGAAPGGAITAGGVAAGGAITEGGVIAAGGTLTAGGAIATGGTIAAGGAIATGGTSTPLDANAFGQRYRISDNELSGWRQDPAPTAFAVYAGDELVTRMDGAADMYITRGCRVSMFQDLVGPDPEIGTVVAMDFVTNVNANAMFTYQRSNGASIAIPGYGTSAAIGLSTLGGIVAYAHFNAVYFEVQLSGFADTTSASAAAGQFLNLLRLKAAGSGPDAGSAGGAGGNGGATGAGGSTRTGGATVAGGSTTTGGTPVSGGTTATGGVATGGYSTGGTSVDGGGSGGTDGTTSNRLVLDPSSLTFFGLPIDSIRWAVAGFAPAARTCVTVMWDYSNTGHSDGAHCDEFGFMFPYVAMTTNTDGPCNDWTYGGQVQVDGWSGCVDFKTYRGMNFVNSIVSVTGTAFTGQVVLDNRSLLPAKPVVFGLKYSASAPGAVYVQTSADHGYPAWVSVTKDGVDVAMFDPCELPVCGGGTTTCAASMHIVLNLTRGTSSGVVYQTWDGLVRGFSGGLGCTTAAPAAAGNYRAKICYATSTTTVSAGTDVANPQCVYQDFTYPTEQVIVTVAAH